jgi:hypothetical protein
MKKLDCPPTKKHRSAQVAPEVHIKVNIMPTPGTGSPAMQGSYVVSGTPVACSGLASAPGPLHADQVGNAAGRTENCSTLAAPTPAGCKVYFLSTRKTRFSVLLDCVRVNRIPSVHKLLTMMDLEDLAVDLKYVDTLSKMQDLQIDDVLDVYSLHECYLANFGSLGRDGARHLRQFAHDKLLVPLELLEVERSSKEPSIVEIAAPTVPVSRQKKDKANNGEYDRAIKVEEQSREAILEWISGVDPSEGVDTRSVHTSPSHLPQ